MRDAHRPDAYISCAHKGCEAKFRDHAWGHILADGWFQQKDGKAWCPDHIPDWVPEWRARQAAKKRKE